MKMCAVCFITALLVIQINAIPADSLKAQEAAPAPYSIDDNGFVPSGWMGDAAKKDNKNQPFVSLSIDGDQPHSKPNCWKLEYRPGPDGWAAIAWQFPEKNWGEKPGKNLNGRGFRQLSIWARGVRDSQGNLPRVQFKTGGGTDPSKKNQASFEINGEFTTLTEEWSQYKLVIGRADFKQVISAFTVVVRALDLGQEGAKIYLDDIEYQ